jgi:hypothetical protein
MGLLDDAIREHLELKRRRGADPGEVAREQHEALEPVVPVQSAANEIDGEYPDDAAVEDSEAVAPQEAPHADQPAEDSFPLPGPEDAAAVPEFSPGGQETAELDMQSVLHEDHSEHDAAGEAEEIFEEHGEIPGQEHLRFE